MIAHQLEFAGNDETELHKNLGEKLEIVGKGLTKVQVGTFSGIDGNIAVKSDNGKLEISLSESLKAMDSFETKVKKVRDNRRTMAKSNPDGAGLHLSPFIDEDGIIELNDKEAHYGLLGSTVKDGAKTNVQTAGENKLTDGTKRMFKQLEKAS